MQAHPLIPPHIAPGCWPEATDEDKKNALHQVKQTRWMNAGMESCISKGILAGVAGQYFLDEPSRHTLLYLTKANLHDRLWVWHALLTLHLWHGI